MANEVVHWVKKSKLEVVLLKLDFQIAYDMVNWNFLDHVLESMDFGRNGEVGFSSVYHLLPCQLSLIVPHHVHSKCIEDLSKGVLFPRFYSFWLPKCSVRC